MADLIEPTQRSFQNAETTASDVLTQASPNLLTKTGSVIRELIIRPVAYLMSWLDDNYQNTLEKSSVAYLKTSQETVNPTADLVASNYFVTRLTGTSARGILTLTLTQPVLRIGKGSPFTVGGASMVTPDQYFITNSDTSGTSSDFTYVKSIPYGDRWIANISVVSTEPGQLELPVGSEVSIGFSSSIIMDAELTSPVTGGSDVETDAELMKRAEYNTAESGIGSFYGLQKKFAKAPVAVLGLSAVAGEDEPLFRARYNNVNINPGGIVDCYVKTAKQPTTDSFQVSCTGTGGKLSGTVPADCILHVDSVIVDGQALTEFDVDFQSWDTNVSEEGARLSIEQKTVISFQLDDTSATSADATVFCTYLPGIRALQSYIDSDEEHYLGMDTAVKAAVPVELTFHCGYKAASMLDADRVELLRSTIENYINNIQVGTRTVNFSDIREVCASAVPEADLRLPCVMTAKAYTRNGGVDTFHSNTGILDISDQANQDFWDFRECFFSICFDNIKVEAV